MTEQVDRLRQTEYGRPDKQPKDKGPAASLNSKSKTRKSNTFDALAVK